MKEKILLFGSTGSIGTQTLDIIRANRDKLEVILLTCGRNTKLLEEQIAEFNPKYIWVDDKEEKERLKAKYNALKVYSGQTELFKLAALEEGEIVVNALVGAVGTRITLEGIKSNKKVALANKESLVSAGRLVMEALEASTGELVPIDSEHSAIWQSLMTMSRGEDVIRRLREVQRLNECGERGVRNISPYYIHNLILTASGGPFRGYTLEQLEKVKLSDALKHPNWTMGRKITIDSATLMNKALEIIEASRLFSTPGENIKVLVHPQSILHSAVEFKDGSIIGQMGMPDMRQPIQYALMGNDKRSFGGKYLNFFDLKQGLTFEKPDARVFPSIGFAFDALKRKDSYACYMNMVNECLVEAFLQEKIRFINIFQGLEHLLERHEDYDFNQIDDAEAVIEEAISHSREFIKGVC